jgi:hypothetical protein
LAESVIKRINGNLRLSTYLEFTEQYEESSSHITISLEPAKRFISSLKGPEVGGIMQGLKDIAIKIGDQTGIKSQLSDESKLYDADLKYGIGIPPDTRELIAENAYTVIKDMKILISRGHDTSKHRFYETLCVKSANYELFKIIDQYDNEMYSGGIEIHRLINLEVVGEDRIKEHIKKFSNVISAGKYIVTLTNHTGFDVVIGVGYQKKDIAVQLFPDPYTQVVNFGICSYNPMYIVSMTRLSENLEDNGKKLQEHWDPNKIDESIDKWLVASKSTNLHA